MNKYGLEYEAPKTKIYRFGDNDRILTESGEGEVETPSSYAAYALNQFIDRKTTTIEKK